MRNYRIKQSYKHSCEFVQYEIKLFGLSRWVYVRNNEDSAMRLPDSFQIKIWFWLLAFSPIISILMCSLFVAPKPNFMGILSVLLLIASLIFMIFFLVAGSRSFFKKRKFYSSGKSYIETVLRRQEIDKRPEKVIGIFLNGEYIDGDRLERLKKFERIVDDNV